MAILITPPSHLVSKNMSKNRVPHLNSLPNHRVTYLHAGVVGCCGHPGHPFSGLLLAIWPMTGYIYIYINYKYLSYVYIICCIYHMYISYVYIYIMLISHSIPDLGLRIPMEKTAKERVQRCRWFAGVAQLDPRLFCRSAGVQELRHPHPGAPETTAKLVNFSPWNTTVHIYIYIILYCIIYYIVLYYIVLYYIILYCIVLYYIILYYIILFYIILYYIYYIVLYYIILHIIYIYISYIYNIYNIYMSNVIIYTYIYIYISDSPCNSGGVLGSLIL